MLDVMTFDRSIHISSVGSSGITLSREQAEQVAGLLLKAVAAANAGQSGVVGHVEPARPHKLKSSKASLLAPIRSLANAVRGAGAKGAPSASTV